MSDDTSPPAGSDPFTSAPAPEAAPQAMSTREAAQALAAQRWKRDNPEATSAEPAAEPPQNLDSDPPQEAPAEATAEAPVEPEAELPPIDPPRSWPKDWKDDFAGYPRELQEKIAQREQQRDSELRRGQNEHAEKLKGLTAKEQQAEQARQQYEQALPALLQALQTQQQGEFADIKTIDDVTRLAREDWPRYALWDAHQKKLAAVQQELQAAEQRKQEKFDSEWNNFATEQDRMFAEKAPEMADEKKRQSLMTAAQDVVRDYGFTEQELAELWAGKASLSLRDHRLQLLIRDAVNLREAKKLAAKPAPKAVPPVQRPGVSGARIDQANLEIRALEQRATETGNARDFAKLLAARRAQATRRTG